MGIVAIDMSMSLDGYIAAPNDVPGDGLGEDGMRLHNWGFDNPGVFERVFDGAKAVAGDKRIGLMGADVPRQFLAAGLVDEIRIHLVDVLLGGGRRMFEELSQRIELKQTELYEAGGVAHVTYRVIR